ncbi:MAG TPA: TrkA C-terminal domain-containing protein, partial [Polyangiaceae bacterium]|nr:TrkA C-terminal domain-containing protein [Polyangiaceae bacterium]
DIVTAVGSVTDMPRAKEYFGETSDDRLDARRDRIDMRRVLVSKREHVGRSIEELDLERRFNAQVTRLRRADLDIVPSPDLRLELGDRLRVVAPTDRLKAVSAFFGDSARELAEIDYVALALGLCAGLLLGRVPIPLFGTTLELGVAGGPLLVSLVVGRLGRSGPFVWMLPYEASTLLRELGLLLFLAGVGTSAGGLLASVINWQGLVILALGALVTLVTSVLLLLLARTWAKASLISSLGAASGMQTQPATLAAAYELSGRSEETYVAYAVVYPVAMIAKILLAQVLALAL